jgi:Mn2+/Fe2+ NRAMP family transporter
MVALTNTRLTTIVAVTAALLLVGLNTWLIVLFAIGG